MGIRTYLCEYGCTLQFAASRFISPPPAKTSPACTFVCLRDFILNLFAIPIFTIELSKSPSIINSLLASIHGRCLPQMVLVRLASGATTAGRLYHDMLVLLLVTLRHLPQTN